MTEKSFDVRDGDVLVVTYPEVTVPLVDRFAICKVGGLIYTRKLVAGDSVEDQYTRIYAFLKRKAEADGEKKIAELNAELDEARRKR